MRRILRNMGRYDWVRPTVLLLLVCHVGRFYSDAPMALAICFDHNHPGEVLTSADDHHAQHMESAALASHPESHDDLGYKLEHCRDKYMGVSLAPVSLMSLPAELGRFTPAGDSSMVALPDLPQFSEPSLDIFHPPQLLS